MQTEQPYYYDGQIKKFIAIFMAVFSGLSVRTGVREDGEIKTLTVPIVYGSKDRVTAAILNDNTQVKPIRLPILSAYMSDMSLAEHRMKGVGGIRNTPHVPVGGLLPDDVVNLQQRMPVPYDLTFELSMYTSNLDQRLQILEQIMMVFDPLIQIERSDAPFDWAKVMTLKLTGIQFDEGYPSGTDRRKLQTTLRFEMPVWIESPARLRNNLVKSIHLRIQALGTGDDLADAMSSVMSASDSDYELLADAEPLRE